MTERKKPLSMKEALKLMRRGDGKQRACLLNEGGTYYVQPDGGWVKRETAEAIKRRPDVFGNRDSLWPGLDQTWRFE